MIPTNSAPKSDNTPSVQMVVENNGKFEVVLVVGVGGMATQMAEIHDMSSYMSVINSDNFDSPEFHQLKNICSFLPVRVKGTMYQKFCMGMFQTNRRNEIVSDSNKTSIFLRYTSEINWFCTRINIYLALDAAVLETYSEYIKELKCCIGCKHRNTKGNVLELRK